jgi:hypothetical protein
MASWWNPFSDDEKEKVAPSVTGPHGPATFAKSWIGSTDYAKADEKAVAAVQKAKDEGVTDKSELRRLRDPTLYSALARKALGSQKKIQAPSIPEKKVVTPVKKNKGSGFVTPVLTEALEAGRQKKKKKKAHGGYVKKYARGGGVRKAR